MPTITTSYRRSHLPLHPFNGYIQPSNNHTSLLTVPVSQWDLKQTIKQTFTLNCPSENSPTIRILPYGKGTLKDLQKHLVEMKGYWELDGYSIGKILQVTQDETCDIITLLPSWQDFCTITCRVLVGQKMRATDSRTA